MSGGKKLKSTFEDSVNAKIQRKFDSVIIQKPKLEKNIDKDESTILESPITSNNKKIIDESSRIEKMSEKTKINLNFSSKDLGKKMSDKKTKDEEVPKVRNDGLDFTINFNMDDAPLEITGATALTDVSIIDEIMPKENDISDDGLTLDKSVVFNNVNSEATERTIVINRETMTKSDLDNFALDKENDSNPSSVELMSTEEARTNIESTIKDILRPKLDPTKEFDLNEKAFDEGPMSVVEDSELSYRNTASLGYEVDEVGEVDEFAESTFLINHELNTKTNVKLESEFESESESEDSSSLNLNAIEEKSNFFSIGDDIEEDEEKKDKESVDFSDQSYSSDLDKTVIFQSKRAITEKLKVSARIEKKEVKKESPKESSKDHSIDSHPVINSEDSIRFQATIRALREERDEVLGTIKSLKVENKEVEQDNLTLRANLDEAKIEITILRKRHMVELEDLKYRLGLSEEKKLMSVELARQADLRREKLEQKVRIDFNQVKQREKELESKLELLSMDVESQVQSRDQKILELRRKIDALEFNMENASIKEQKSFDDKRKLEDRLSKIMKTLRYSIKNLEDDIEHMEDDGDLQKDKI